jgi:hypothetical protein
MEEIMNGAMTRTNRFGDNRDPTFPQFTLEPVLDELATQRAGRAIYRDEERVKIHIPGNNLTIPVERVNDEHRARWPDHYKRFKDGQQMSHDGTPLEMWPAISSKSQVLYLKSHEIHTVEQMATVTDYNLNQLGMGARQLRDLAGAFLDDAKRNAMTKSLMSVNEKLEIELLDAKTQIGELKNMVLALQGQIEGLANRPNMIAHHVPGQHDPFAAFASPTPAAPAAPADPLASFAAPAAA